MKKIVSILMLISILFFISGCSNVDLSKVSDEDLERISDKAVVCNEPYIRLGTSCCLDDNKNNICDKDEKDNIEEEKNQENNTNQSIDNNSSLSEESTAEEDSLNINREEVELTYSEADGVVNLYWTKYWDSEEFKEYKLQEVISDNQNYKAGVAESASSGCYVQWYSDIENTESIYTHLEDKETKFLISVVLKNGTYINSNLITVKGTGSSDKYDTEPTIEIEEEYQRCRFSALVETKESIYLKGASFDIDTKEKCLDEFENIIQEHESFQCSETIFYREALYRETSSDDYETIKLDECPIKEFDEKKVITISDGETQTVSIGGKDYQVYIDDVFDNGIGEVMIGENSEDFVEIFDKTSIGNMYVLILDIITSARAGVSGYSEIAIGNYDFSLTSSDVSEICYENGQSSEEQTSVLAKITGDNFEVKESYCSADSTLTQYTCDGPDDGMEELEIDCEYGCESGRCLKITDVGCDKDELGSGLLTLGDGESMTLNNSTLLEIVEVGDGMAEIKVDSSTEYVEMCKEEAIGEITILIHDTVQSSREGVKGWMEFSYN